MKCACVCMYQNEKRRLNVESLQLHELLTWFSQFIRSVSFVNTPSSVEVYFFFFHSMNSNICHTNSNSPYRLRFSLSAFIFTPNKWPPQSKYETTTKQNIFLAVHRRVKPTLCSQKRTVFSCLYLQISLLLLPFMLCFSFWNKNIGICVHRDWAKYSMSLFMAWYRVGKNLRYFHSK